MKDPDPLRRLLALDLDEAPAETPRQERAEYEGAHNSPALCAGCGFSLTAPRPCPKCAGTTREIDTAFVRRDLSELLDQHRAGQSSRQAAAAKKVPPGSPLAIARASGYPQGNREFRTAYHRAYLAAQKQQSEKPAAEKKKKKKIKNKR
jgi:hypothetical protein